MSILAERKRKQKWSLNPRGKAWSEDANKFGQKMLEKMGWQQGKGLGANENGITQHVKMPYKNDTRGMGFKESDSWTEHDVNFNAILQSLSEINTEETKSEELKLNSLEKNSQSSRARIHYHKFTRGKDLSRYSEKDLANIFGKKSLKKSIKQDQSKDEETTSKDKENVSKLEDSGLLVNAGSMTDYFKKKISGFSKNNGYKEGSNGVVRNESESESELRTIGFGFKAGDNTKTTCVSYIDELNKKRQIKEHLDDNIFSPKKKRKKEHRNNQNQEAGLTNSAFNPLSSHVKIQKHALDTIPESCTEEEVNQTLEDNDNFSPSEEVNQFRNNKNSIKKNKGIENAIGASEHETLFNGIENPIFNENSIEEIEDSVRNPFEVNFGKKKNKSSKKKMKTIENPIDAEKEISASNRTEPSVFNENNSESEEVVINPFEIKRKKKKKKKLKMSVEGNAEFPSIEQQSDSLNEKTKTSKSKKKKCSTETNKKTEFVFNNPNFKEDNNNSIDDSVIVTEVNPYEVELKPKKKKTKSKYGIENINFNESTEINLLDVQVEENPYEIKPKKKKKEKKKLLHVTETFNNNEALATPLKNPYEVKLSKKEKKKKKKEIAAVDNPNFILNSSSECEGPTENNLILNVLSNSFTVHNSCDIEESDLILNIATTPLAIKKKDTSQNETRITSVKRRKSVRFSDVTQELIIPNNEELRRMEQDDDVEDSSLGVDNINFDTLQNRLDEDLETMSNAIEQYQAEVENDINEKKQTTLEDILIGEVGNPHGENEKLPHGTKLKFKYAHFSAKTPFYHLDKVGSRKSYKHLIKGDIVLQFKNTNLHEIQGYAIKKNKMQVV